ncbi:MAG: hypothetical protein N3B21_19375 [Clostridia bacterium]|nr:hypothetical protein [Clostridia bacterium]
MSYSLITKCGECGKAATCTDRNILMGAIHGIHYNTFEQGHQGAGTIVVNCCRQEGKDLPAKEAEETK